MKKHVTGALTLALALAQIGAAQARSNYIPRTERGRMVQSIVERWAVEGARLHETTPRGWAGAMAGAFEHASLQQLRSAAAASTFAQVTRSLSSSASLMPVAHSFYPLVSCRMVDSRKINKPFIANETYIMYARVAPEVGFPSFALTGGSDGDCGIPSTAKGLVLRITAVRPANAGHLTVWNSLNTIPVATSLNYLANANIGGETHVLLAPDGITYRLFTNQTTHLVVDVTGYFVPNQ